MKWILGCLLALNVGYFAWHWYAVDASVGSESPAAPHDTAKALPEDGGKTLVLLSEVKQEELEGLLAAKQRLKMAVDQALPETAADQQLCSMIGPFKALLQAEYFAERLKALDINASVEQVEVPGEDGFWVYQASQLSRKAALRRLYEFQAKGVDSYIIPRGELENGISFGIYPSQEQAEVRRAEIEALGFVAEIKSAERSYQEIWLVLQPQEAAKADEELWLELINPKDNVELLQNFCPGVAPR